MTQAKLLPRMFLIEQTQSEYPYWIQLLDIYNKPLWYILLRPGDTRAYVPELKAGYETAEQALAAWQKPMSTSPPYKKGSIYDPYFGLYDEQGNYPQRQTFFGTSNDRGEQFSRQLSMEQLLQNFAVFKNGIRGDTCHMDSYMTVVDYKCLEACLTDLKERYAPTAEDWRPLVEDWIGNPNQQPPIMLVAFEVARSCGLDKEAAELAEKRREARRKS